MKFMYNFFQYAYLFIAAFFVYSAIADYTENGTRFWLYGLMALAAIGMFFLKRYMGKKIQKSQKD